MTPHEETDFRFLAEYSMDILCRAGLDLVLNYISPSSLKVLGWRPEEMVGKPAPYFIHPDDVDVLKSAVGDEEHTVMFRMLKADGTYAWMENRARLVHDPVTGAPQEWVVLMRDTTERKLLEEKLAAMAMTDGLTGLANRRAFDQELERQWRRALRDSSPISLLLLDIDYFKRFNDQYGHQVGDDCLRVVSRTTQENIRSTDFAARYGGEELAVILPSTDSTGALEVAEKIRAAIEALRLPNEQVVSDGTRVTVSIGVATVVTLEGALTRMPESMLLAADSALYKAKHEGRNRLATSLLLASTQIPRLD